MKRTLILLSLIALTASFVIAQPASVERKFTKTDTRELLPGGSFSLLGAPNGNIKLSSWRENRVEVTAEISLTAPSDADAAKLAEFTTFVFREALGSVSVLTVGTHDRSVVKAAGKRLPKNLVGLPFRIDYSIKVPVFTNLMIDNGIGNVFVSGTEGSIQASLIESNATFHVAGESNITVGKGSVKVWFGSGGWRGRRASVSIGAGDLSATFPENTSADLDAVVLRSGSISNNIASLKPRDAKVAFTERSLIGRFSAGGVLVKLTVGDGTLSIYNPDRDSGPMRPRE